MTRVALLLSGNARWCADFDRQINNLVNAEVDWHVLLWRKDHTADTRISPNWARKTDQEARTFIEARLPPGHQLKLLEWIAADAAPLPTRDYPAFYSHPVNFFQQYWILDQLGQRVQGDYDLWIRSRPDIGLDRLLDLTQIKQLLDQNPKALVLPLNERRGHSGFCDQFAIGSPQNIRTYCSVLGDFDRVFNEGTVYNPEYIVGRSLQDQGLTWPPTDFHIELRAQGQHVPGHFHPAFGRWL
jgi:hypothetical protein